MATLPTSPLGINPAAAQSGLARASTKKRAVPVRKPRVSRKPALPVQATRRLGLPVRPPMPSEAEGNPMVPQRPVVPQRPTLPMQAVRPVQAVSMPSQASPTGMLQNRRPF